MIFENGTLSLDWYNGSKGIYILEFHRCNLQVIEEHAFTHESFYFLSVIGFHHMNTLIHFEDNVFRGLRYINSIEYNCLALDKIEPKKAWGIENSLDMIEIRAISPPMSIQDIVVKNLALKIVEFHRNPYIKLLSPDNFTSLPMLSHLYIDCTGIEVILDGTFDSIASTLSVLQMSNNQLTALNPSVFYQFLLNNCSSPFSKFSGASFLLDENIDCDCNYIWLKYLAIINIGIYGKSIVIECQIINNHWGKIIEAKMCSMETIHLKKVNMISREYRMYAFAKFEINVRINESEIQLQTKNKMNESFRIIFIPQETNNGRDLKYPNPEWILDNVKCILMKNEMPDLWLTFESDPIRFTLIVIHYKTNKRIWPLHILSIRPRDLVDIIPEENLSFAVPFGGAICIFGLIFGIGLNYCFRKCKTEDVNYVRSERQEITQTVTGHRKLRP